MTAIRSSATHWSGSHIILVLTMALLWSAPTSEALSEAETLRDACTLLSKAEVEHLTGSSVLEPVSESLPPTLTCYYGAPGSPILKNRPLDSLATISITSGVEGEYFAGPDAQAKDAFAMIKDGAAEPESVDGIGDDAFWDATFKSLHVLRGKFVIDITVSSETAGLETGKAIAQIVVGRLP